MEAAILRPQKLYEQVASRILSWIRSNKYGDGDYLPPERELVEMFGIGRTAIREALFSLSKIGLVEIRSGKPARVTVPTAERLLSELSDAAQILLIDEENVRQLQDARKSLEASLAQYAALHATPEDILRCSNRLECRLSDP